MNYEQTIATYQPMLQAIAYRFVRCKADAEDIVQETFLKWLSLGPQQIGNLKAYLVRAVTNNCLNHLEALRKKKEKFFNTTNFTEIITHFKETNLAHLDVDIDVSVAWKVLLTKLEPLERAIYLLKEVFDFDYDALQETFNKKKEHCRQLLCRAKKKLQSGTPEKGLIYREHDRTGFLDSLRKALHRDDATELILKLKKDIPASL